MGMFDWLTGGDDNQTTQTSTVEPYEKSKPLINRALADVMKLYNSGVGSNVYTGSTVIPYAQQTMWGMNNLQQLANANDGSSSNFMKRLQSIMNNGGFSGTQRDAIGGMQDIAGDLSRHTSYLAQNGGLRPGQVNDLKAMRGATGSISDLLGQLGRTGGLSTPQNDALKYYQGIAGSKFDYSPDFQKVLDAGLQDAREGVNANASAAGRYGSGIAQGVMAKELGNLSNTARLAEYRDWQGRKDAANTNMANLGQTGVGNLSSLSQLQSSLGNAALGAANTGTQNLQNLYGLGNTLNSSLFNAGQAGLGNMGTAYQTAQLPAQTLMQLGGMNEDLAGRIKNDELRIFDAKNASPWDQIGRLMQVANLGGAYKTSSTTSQQPGQNPFMNALGIGLGGLSLFG
jgi:hypothetical protein